MPAVRGNRVHALVGAYLVDRRAPGSARRAEAIGRALHPEAFK